jgi:inward rectifier potassium channel
VVGVPDDRRGRLRVCLNGLFAGVYLATGATIQNAEAGSFRDAFFFSIQTMSTIGYGTLAPGDVMADSLVAI